MCKLSVYLDRSGVKVKSPPFFQKRNTFLFSKVDTKPGVGCPFIPRDETVNEEELKENSEKER